MSDLVGRAALFSAYSGTVRRGVVPLKSAANDNHQGSKWDREAIPSSPTAWVKSVGTTVAETLGFGTFGETEEEKSKRLEKERIAKAVEEFERNHDEYKKLADIEAAEQESAKILMDHAAVADYEPDTPEDEKTRQLLAEYLAENPSLIDKFIDLPEDVWITNKAANYLAGKISAISKSIKRTAAQCGKEVAEFIKDECPTCVKVLSQTVDTASELADHSFPVVAQQIARMEFAQEINDISSVVGNYIDRKTTPDQREAASAIVSLLSIFVPLGIMGKAKFAAKLDKIGDIIDQAPGAPLVFKRHWQKHIEFKGNKVYQRDDLIDPKRINPENKKTSLENMRKGKAPTGPDGEPINLHHTIQTQKGPIAEVTEDFHKKYTKAIHINPKNTGSGIDRREFDKWREQYWKERAKGFEDK